jgi:hypothetical protein
METPRSPVYSLSGADKEDDDDDEDDEDRVELDD